MTLHLRLMLAASLVAAALGTLMLTAAPRPSHVAAIVADCQPGRVMTSDGIVYICSNDGKWVRL
jgi:hypothetical protein